MNNKENILPIRVLCVFACLDRGGAESMCMSLYRNIDRSKVQFDFVKHTYEKGCFEDEIIALGGRIYEAPKYKIYNHLSYCNWWKKHFRAHPEHKIIHGHYFTISAIYFRIAKKYSRITIAHSHTSEFKTKKIMENVKQLFQRNIEDYSDYAFACSNSAGKWLFPNKKFELINNAIDTSVFCFSKEKQEQFKKKLGIENRFVLGTVGNIAGLKNPYGIIEIIKACKEKIDNFIFLWVGGGPLWLEIKEKLKVEGLEDSVILTGVSYEITKVLHVMDAFILPSFSEGLPVSVIEAQSVGLPCFVSDVITSEVIITKNCFKLPLDNPQKWAEAISNVNVFERKDMTQEIIDAGYNIQTTSKKLEEFYIGVLN